MRRAPIVITATVLGTAGVLLFKPLAASSIESTGSASGSTGSSSSSSETAGASSSSSTPAPSTSSGSSSSSTSSSGSSSSSAKTVSATVTGAVETDRFGNTQVKVTLKDGKITEITTLQYNDGDPRSAEISQQAIPLLRQEVLSNQTAAVDTVSGATYTSNAYEASLQSALDKAGYSAPDGSKASTDLSSLDSGLGFGH
jgi:uncharacterized protein with FMN-binding domain